MSIVSMASIPFLGVDDYAIAFQKKLLHEEMKREDVNVYSKSQFVFDDTMNSHPRFGGLLKAIRGRRGEKVKILAPLFKDKNTNMTEATKEEPIPGQIYMDAMHFGMGCSCL